MRYANYLIPYYSFTHAFALSFAERRRVKNMANQSKMQLAKKILHMRRNSAVLDV